MLLRQVVPGTALLRQEKIQRRTLDREFPSTKEEEDLFLFQNLQAAESVCFWSHRQEPERESNPEPSMRRLCWPLQRPHLSYPSHLISMCVLHLNTRCSEQRFRQLTRLWKSFVTQTPGLCTRTELQLDVCRRLCGEPSLVLSLLLFGVSSAA